MLKNRIHHKPSMLLALPLKDNYNQFIADNKETLVIIKASAEWCSPCQQLKPIYQNIASGLKGKVKCAEIDVDSFALLDSLKTIKG